MLPESGRLLQLVLDTIPVRVFWKDNNLAYLGCNRLFALDAGLKSPEQIIGKNDYELGWREQAERYRADDWEVIQTGQPKLNYEEPQTSPDGRLIWLRTSKFPLRDAQGEIIGVMGIYEEITDQRRALQALAESEERFRSLVEQSRDGIVLTDEQGNIIEWNPARQQMTGLSRAEVLGRPIWDVMFDLVAPELRTPENYERLKTNTQAFYLGNSVPWLNRPVDGMVYHRNGEWRYIQDVIFPIQTGERWMLASISRDLTDFRRLERERQRTQARYQTLVEMLPLGVEETDIHGIIQFSNPAHHKMLGYEPGELIGKPVWQVTTTPEETARNLLAKLVTEQPDPAPLFQKNRTKDGRVIDVRMDWNYLRDAQGQLTGFVSILTDITETRRMEAYLKHIATHDPLTDLPNRAYLYDRLRHAITLARRHQHQLAVLYLDIDGFKLVNDRLGHAVGDQLLKRISQRLRRCIRLSDTVARLGGDEFAFLMEQIKEPADAGVVAAKVLAVLARPFRLQGQDIHITGSIGISFYPEHGEKPSQLVRAADEAMYRAKQAGKNQYKSLLES